MVDQAAGTHEITAALVREKGSFEPGPVLIEPPRADEVLVRIVATGLCHTDLVVRDQVYPVPLPTCSAMRAPESWRRSVARSRRSWLGTMSR